MGSFLIILTAAFGLLASARGDALPPDTYSAEMFKKFVDAINTGDKSRWEEFVLLFPNSRENPETFERRVKLLQIVYEELGGVKLDSVLESDEYHIAVRVRGLNPIEDMEYARIMMEFDPEPPHGWLRVGLMPADDPNEVIPQFDNDEALASYLDRYLDSLASADKFSGTVLIARGDRIIFKDACGEANKRYHIPNRIDTKLNLGSMNKMFTGTAVVQLAEQGKLRFEDTIDKYLPDYPNQEAASKITIHHLLTHTSGLGDYWEDLYNSHWWEVKTVKQLADLIVDKPLEFEPGEKFRYSNSGPVILGLIIEKVTGMDYYEYIREYVCKPAGMINTDSYEMDHPVENLAFGYTKFNYDGEMTEEWYNNLFMHFGKGSPAGGGYSTVEDLFRFSRALTEGKLVGEAYFDTLTTGKVEMGPGMKYAYLFGDEDLGEERKIGHNGGAPGINAVLDIYLDSGYTVAVLSNYDRAAMRVSEHIMKILMQKN